MDVWMYEGADGLPEGQPVTQLRFDSASSLLTALL